MNDLGNTNKMVSDTPRTDGAQFGTGRVSVSFARQLESELNSAQQRIKRLEEALEGTVKWIVDLADSGDAGFWNPEEQHEIIAARAVLKKEAKL